MVANNREADRKSLNPARNEADRGAVGMPEAVVEVLQEPRAGFLGLNPSPAVVRVRTASGSGAGLDAPNLDPSDDQAELAAEFVEGLLDAMGLDADVEISAEHGSTYVEVWGAEPTGSMGILIGRHGRTLEAVQELARTHVHRATGERCTVLIDVEDYRKRRRSQVSRRAREVARRVGQTGRAEALDPMPATERKIVHDVVAEIGGLVTASEGEEPNRHVVVRPGS